MPFWGDMLVPWRVFFKKWFWHCWFRVPPVVFLDSKGQPNKPTTNQQYIRFMPIFHWYLGSPNSELPELNSTCFCFFSQDVGKNCVGILEENLLKDGRHEELLTTHKDAYSSRYPTDRLNRMGHVHMLATVSFLLEDQGLIPICALSRTWASLGWMRTSCLKSFGTLWERLALGDDERSQFWTCMWAKRLVRIMVNGR